MSKVVPLHRRDAMVLPLGEGASLRVTRFHESPRVAVTLHGPGGGDCGGVILHAAHARLLASWLQREADAADGGERVTRRAAVPTVLPVPAPAR